MGSAKLHRNRVRALSVAAAVAGLVLSTDAQAAPRKRDLPNFDGRSAPTTATDVLLWPPRIVLFPLYLTSEFVVRRPLGALATAAEKNHWPTKIIDFFTFDKEHKSGLVPTALYDFGFRPSVGLYFFWDDAGAKNNAFRTHVGFWGSEWLSVAVADRVTFMNGRATWGTRAEFTRRPDGLFAGLGARSIEENLGRFGFRRMATSTTLDVRFWRSSLFRAGVGVRSMDFRDDQQCCDELTLKTRVQAGRLELPPGFEGYTAVHQNLELAIDNRKPDASLTGFRVAMHAEHGGNVRDTRAQQWIHYGGQAAAFADLDGHGRVIGLVMTAFLADPIGGGEIPFTEQVQLPGPSTLGAGMLGAGPMRGFRPGRLVDRSALVATAVYQWPIWLWLDGTVHFAAGNVWGPHFRDLDAKLLRFSTGIGFRTVGSPDNQFELLIGTGTETIEEGLRPNLIRILFGATRGF
jgi:hypothetical protein